MRINERHLCALAAIVLLTTSPAKSATVWTNWTSATAGINGGGSASGTVSGIGVSYSGELDSAVTNGTSSIWAPNSSFVGGSSTVSPSSVGDDLRLNGSSTGVNTITFSSPVLNPVFAIWSLGQPGNSASFVFSSTPTLQAGGPNSSFGGASITISGNTVNGAEGNGVVQFTGTFNSITWTNTFENFYAFTVGINGTPENVVPEPGTWTLAAVAIGFAALASRRLRAAAR